MEQTLHMFSGGRDSLLSAAIMAEKGFHVLLTTYDNGCIHGISDIYDTIMKLINRYPKIETIGVGNVGMTVNNLKNNLFSSISISQLASTYPNLVLGQMNCLYCKMAMFIHAIAYCVKHDIHNISDGTRVCQNFYVDSESFQIRIENICSQYQIALHNPVYYLSSDITRKEELCQRDLPTKVHEMQCFVGMPMIVKLSEREIKSLNDFMDEIITPKAIRCIDGLISPENYGRK